MQLIWPLRDAVRPPAQVPSHLLNRAAGEADGGAGSERRRADRAGGSGQGQVGRLAPGRPQLAGGPVQVNLHFQMGDGRAGDPQKCYEQAPSRSDGFHKRPSSTTARLNWTDRSNQEVPGPCVGVFFLRVSGQWRTCWGPSVRSCQALELARQALDLFQEAGDLKGQATRSPGSPDRHLGRTRPARTSDQPQPGQLGSQGSQGSWRSRIWPMWQPRRPAPPGERARVASGARSPSLGTGFRG